MISTPLLTDPRNMVYIQPKALGGSGQAARTIRRQKRFGAGDPSTPNCERSHTRKRARSSAVIRCTSSSMAVRKVERGVSFGIERMFD